MHVDTNIADARLDIPPQPGARLRLPDDFGVRFALFGDAEEEFDWNKPFDRHSTSTTTMSALPDATRRFQAAGIEPCWLADWPIVDNPLSGGILRALVDDRLCTVGTQLHPWVNPPFSEEVNKRNSYTCNLPVSLQEEKLVRLTQRIEEVVGTRPRIYRAGRYGIGPETARLLARHGYKLDVSVRAHFDYRNQGGPNFTGHPLWPWTISDGLYELPLTTGHTGPLGRWPRIHLAESLRGTLARTGLFARVPLTPEGTPLADALEAIEALLGEGHRLFSMSFHTPSLVPGHTPYVRDATDLANFWCWWDGVFDRFAKHGATPIGANAIIDAFEGIARDGHVPPVPPIAQASRTSVPIVSRQPEGSGRKSEIVPLADWIANPDPAWDAIARRPSEPNSFLEPWFLSASVRHLDVPADARMMAVREEGQLIGIMPIFTAPNYGRIPVPHAQNWLHYNSFFGAPLVRRSFEPFFWSRALAMLDAEMGAPPFLHIVGLDAEGPLLAALFCARAGVAVVHRIKRALLSSTLSPTAYYEASVRKKKRKEIGRLRSRLAELGTVEYRRLGSRDDLDAWIDAFLALEASGWKGANGGSALAKDFGTAAFTREAIRGAFDAGRLEIVRLDLDGRVIAMLVNFLSPPGSYSFKIAFDEDYARFSPGVLVQIENLKILDRPHIAWMDSCAVEGHPMIESLWRERRDIVRVTVPLKGWRRRATFTAARTLEESSALVRKVFA